MKRIYSGTATLFASPLPLADGRVLLGDADGRVIALDGGSGEIVWRRKLEGTVFGDLAQLDGVVAVGTLDGNVYGVAGASGETLWSARLDAPITGDVFAYRGAFYTGDAEGALYRLDPRSGKVLFKTQLASQRLQARGAAKDGVIYLGAWDGCLHAVDASDGKPLWRWKSERNYRFYSPGDAGVAVRDGKVYFAHPDRWVRALDAATGRELWATDNAMVRESFALSADGEKLLAKTLDGNLAVMPLDGGAPDLVPLDIPGKLGDVVPSAQGRRCLGGEIVTGAKRKEVSSQLPVEWNGLCWAGSDSGAIRGIDLKTLGIVFRGEVGGEVRGLVVSPDGEALYIGEIDGSLWRLARD